MASTSWNPGVIASPSSSWATFRPTPLRIRRRFRPHFARSPAVSIRFRSVPEGGLGQLELVDRSLGLHLVDRPRDPLLLRAGSGRGVPALEELERGRVAVLRLDAQGALEELRERVAAALRSATRGEVGGSVRRLRSTRESARQHLVEDERRGVELGVAVPATAKRQVRIAIRLRAALNVLRIEVAVREIEQQDALRLVPAKDLKANVRLMSRWKTPFSSRNKTVSISSRPQRAAKSRPTGTLVPQGPARGSSHLPCRGGARRGPPPGRASA